MTTLQHTLCDLLPKSITNTTEKEIFEKELPYILLPDFIRKWIKDRKATHFENNEQGTDTSYFVFPTCLKNLTKEDAIQLEQYIAKSRNAVLGERTNIAKFEEKNSHLFKGDFYAIEKHLLQDKIFDEFIREHIDCSQMYEDSYVFQGIEYNGKEIRDIIKQIEDQGLYILAAGMYKSNGCITNQKWFDEKIQPILKNAYPQELFENGYKYMKIPPQIDEWITNKDWSHIDENLIPTADYLDFYKKCFKKMISVNFKSKDESETSVEK